MKLFFYGTLMSKCRHNKKPSSGLKYLGEATVSGAMYDCGHYPAVILGGDRQAKGEVYEVTDPKVLSGLDAYEGYIEDKPELSLYVRKKTTTLEGQEVVLYEFNRSVAGLQQVVSGDWYAHTGGRN